MSTSSQTPRSDLTRWNRAGLSRFEYLDGDASVWLEELQIAMLGLYMRGGDIDQRSAGFWRELLTKDPENWPDTSELQQIDWQTLLPQKPKSNELRNQRNNRLLAQYNASRTDYSWETMRAFARASHILLGHANAYANEGYLRTATQWDNLRRLASMVNHQPTPPASATTRIALALKPGVSSVIINQGLAMKYSRPEGGAPLVFETLEEIEADFELNAVRIKDWDKNSRPITFQNGSSQLSTAWIVPKKAEPAPGGLAVLTDGLSASAVSFADVQIDADKGLAQIKLGANVPVTYAHWNTRLHVLPDNLATGLMRQNQGEVILEVEGGASFEKGQIVEVRHNETKSLLVIDEVENQRIRFITDKVITGLVSLVQLAQYSVDQQTQVATAPTNVKTMYFTHQGEIYVSSEVSKPQNGLGITVPVLEANNPPRDGEANKTIGFKQVEELGVIISHEFGPTGFRTKFGYAPDDEAKLLDVQLKGEAPKIIPGRSISNQRVISFSGKPPKNLSAGDWFIARSNADDLLPLKVEGVRTSAGEYHIQFDRNIVTRPPETEFHGPMTHSLQVNNHDQNPDIALPDKSLELINVSRNAQVLLKPGRQVILSRIQEDVPIGNANATVTSAVSNGDNSVTLTLDFTKDEDVAVWTKSQLVVRLNCVDISHGETKDGKILGSGDGERNSQVFNLAVSAISHIPSTIAESGVAPDMDVTVDGIVWDYRDFIDPSAEGTKSWSSVLTEDNHLKIHFRRRLPTGTNNIQVKRYRIGTGIGGSGIPPYGFTDTVKKSPFVESVYQPFETSAGADREPVSSLRQSTPSRLTANGRAVSLIDFEHLISGHASVWKARAREITTNGAQRVVQVTLVPADGADLSEQLEQDLRTAIVSRALPGVGLKFAKFEGLLLDISAKVRADLETYERTELTAACSAELRRFFALENRGFAQPVYRSEILAALETVPGVETAIVTGFDLSPSYQSQAGSQPKNVAINDGAIAAIYPRDNQVAYVPKNAISGNTLININVEGLK